MSPQTKVCSNCKILYGDIGLNFYTNGPRFRSECKTCVRRKVVARQRKNQAVFNGYKIRRLDCLPIRERLWLKSKIMPNGCVEWQGCKPRGYGYMRLMGKTYFTHRLSYELEFGPILDDGIVCHTCHNPPCINPSHLYLGTPSDNVRDMVEAGRHWITKAKAEGVFRGK